MRQQSGQQGRMTAQQYRAQLQGKVNRAQGAAFEDAINASCLYYELQGEAYIEKTPEPMKIIQVLDRIRGIFKAVFQKPAQPDYKGTMKGGQAVCFEAKHTDTDRIKQSAVTPEQRDALDKHQAMGAFCFVLVSLGHRFYRVPWDTWVTMKARYGHKYMSQEELEPFQVEYRDGAIRFLGLTTSTRAFLDRKFRVDRVDLVPVTPGIYSRVENAGPLSGNEERGENK